MVKLLFVLLGSFWLSCGNTAEAVQNETASSEEKTETIQAMTSDTITEEASVISSEEIIQREQPTEEVVIEKEEPIESNELLKEKTKVIENMISLPNHEQWNKLLTTYVNDKGDVDYKSFLNDISALEEYLDHLAKNSPKKDWSKNEKLAYYINLYNAATVKLILDNYPTKSIKDIKNPWGKDWVKTGEGVLSLGDIEHKILRKMNEPRIHFAINCASFSCPKLLNKAFTATQMEAQLQKATVDFVNDSSRNIISTEKMLLSNIFKWYKKDFTENGSLTDYIKPYTEVNIDVDTDIDYLKYDWNLNEAQ
ncbi:DUF547 domain-containing protein [Maribacter sp. 2308TA10-17]|uniref:DUF547 domain-containing protein n=1 Tax=Maribacter sp. 2308TA10-17 TaxID=3386276 RepID=UPI0039BCEFE3